jgi:phospholipid/cholesterol/gamma-HCH transport system substrate-binding protein
VVAVGAVLAAAIIVAVTLLGGGAPYRIHARFINASQLVKGNLVQVAGRPVGSVERIDLTRNGRADVTFTVDNTLAPLREGTQIVVRQASLSGVANRYLDLRLPPASARAIPDGGVIDESLTTTAVDLDQLFDTLDPPTRKALADVIKGSAAQYADTGNQYGEGLLYLNPSLQASSRFFRELNRDNGLLARFVVSSSQFVTDLADRKDDLAGLIDNLQTTTHALGAEQAPLREAISRLPDFMRRANTTFVNLRSTLDDLDPLVRDSKPVAKALRPFLAQLRPLARDARPTLQDLSALLDRPGPNNDLVELTRAQVPAAKIAVGPVTRNGAKRQGALPASARALSGGAGELDYARPYAPDLLGWFDDFSHSGQFDALGGISRPALHADAFMVINGQLTPVPPELRATAFSASGGVTGQRNRCPGAAEHPADDGSGPFKPTPDYNCDLTQVLPGD